MDIGGLERRSRLDDRVGLFIQKLQDTVTRGALNAADAGRNRGLGQDLEAAQLRRVGNMRAAAELGRPAVDVDNTDNIAVFSPNRAMAPISLASLIGMERTVTGAAPRRSSH